VRLTGTLTVPAGGIYNGSVTTGEDSAVFALLQRLDRKYRRMEEEKAPEVPAVVSTQPLP
jgi:hypothetical protein